MMTILTYFSVVMVLLYAIVVTVPSLGFILKRTKTTKKDLQFPVSIIVAARNEESDIEECISSLLQQEYPAGKMEIIVVDDHSEDATAGIIRRYSTGAIVKYIALPEGRSGKKNAVREAIAHSKHDLLVFTDADCVVGKNWLNSMIEPFSDGKVQLTSGPVIFKKKFRNNFLYAEQIALQVISAGTMILGSPTLLSGANYACRKELLKNDDPVDAEFVSGDDITSLEKAKKSGKVVFVKNKAAIVRTNAVRGWNATIDQRARWVSKTGRLGSDLMRVIGLVVFSANLVLPFLITSVLLEKNALSIGAFCLYSKILIDVLLLSLAVPFFREPVVLLTLPLSEIFYPLITLTAMVRGFGGKVNWKGRRWDR